MTAVHHWNDLVSKALTHFPDCDDRALRASAGDFGALVTHVSASHDLTLAEAAEMITSRLPVCLDEMGQRPLQA